MTDQLYFCATVVVLRVQMGKSKGAAAKDGGKRNASSTSGMLSGIDENAQLVILWCGLTVFFFILHLKQLRRSWVSFRVLEDMMFDSLNDTRYDSGAPISSYYSPLAFATLKVTLFGPRALIHSTPVFMIDALDPISYLNTPSLSFSLRPTTPSAASILGLTWSPTWCSTSASAWPSFPWSNR